MAGPANTGRGAVDRRAEVQAQLVEGLLACAILLDAPMGREADIEAAWRAVRALLPRLAVERLGSDAELLSFALNRYAVLRRLDGGHGCGVREVRMHLRDLAVARLGRARARLASLGVEMGEPGVAPGAENGDGGMPHGNAERL